MTTNSVFKSEEGRKKVLDRYNQILSLLPVGKQYVETSFGRTFLLEAGKQDGPAVLMLHGSCSNSAFWMGEIIALSEQYHVYAVDIIGEAGNSEEIRLDLESDDYALWIREIMDTLNIGRAVIIGNSFGGFLSLKFAAAYPERAEALVLIASAGIAPIRRQFIDDSSSKIKSGEKLSASEEVLGESPIPREVLDFMNLIMENFVPMTDDLPALSDELLNNLKMPVLFIAGEDDLIIDAKASARRLEKLLPDVQTCLLKNCGHAVLQAAAIIMPFLGEKVKTV